MSKMINLRWFYTAVLALVISTLYVSNQIAIISLIAAFGLTILSEFFACKACIKNQAGRYRLIHFALFTFQYGGLLYLLYKGENQIIIWLNFVIVFAVGILGWLQLKLPIKSLFGPSFAGHASLFLLSTFLLFQAEIDRKEQQELTQLNKELVAYHDYWKSKIDSISVAIQNRNPDPVLSIWTDLRRGQELNNQLAYSRKVITEHVTHDFFIEPDQMLQNPEWAANSAVSDNWWLNDTDVADDDYQYKGLKESFQDVFQYQRFRLESLNQWLEKTESIQWFNSLDDRKTSVSAIESTQGLLYVMGTINEMLAHKLTFFELEQFDQSFDSGKNNLAALWKKFQQGNRLKNPISIDWKSTLLALLALAVAFNKYSFKTIGASFILFSCWLVVSGVDILNAIWLPLIVFGVTSFLLDARQVSIYESTSTS